MQPEEFVMKRKRGRPKKQVQPEAHGDADRDNNFNQLIFETNSIICSRSNCNAAGKKKKLGV